MATSKQDVSKDHSCPSDAIENTRSNRSNDKNDHNDDDDMSIAIPPNDHAPSQNITHGACTKVLYTKEDFKAHLSELHHITDRPSIRQRTKKDCHIGRNGQGTFWCGFCEAITPLTKRGIEAWDERFDHIDNYHYKSGREIDTWREMDGRLRGGRKMEDMNQESWRKEEEEMKSWGKGTMSGGYGGGQDDDGDDDGDDDDSDDNHRGEKDKEEVMVEDAGKAIDQDADNQYEKLEEDEYGEKNNPEEEEEEEEEKEEVNDHQNVVVIIDEDDDNDSANNTKERPRSASPCLAAAAIAAITTTTTTTTNKRRPSISVPSWVPGWTCVRHIPFLSSLPPLHSLPSLYPSSSPPPPPPSLFT